jgi:polysaccharide biosynthesis/export protein
MAMKAIWAVACAVTAAGVLSLAPGGSGAEMLREVERLTAIESPSPTSRPSPPASGHSPTAAAGAAAADARYRVGPEDVLRVSVWGNEELTLDVVVRPDGMISLPLIQDMQAKGLTTVELAAVIHQELTAYVKNPQVAVIVLQVNAPKIYILGNVARPGPYLLRGDVSVLQALSLAGGFTEFASKRRIRVVRADGGKQEVRVISYFDLLDANSRSNYLLKAGDTVVVP